MYKTVSRISACGLAGSALLLGASQVQAGGDLGATFGSAIPGFSGSVNFSDSFSGFTVDADVFYAVFAPGDYPFFDPSAGTEYVYAYEILNNDTPVTKLTVGLDGDEPLGVIGADISGAVPTASAFIGAGPTSAAWDFTAPDTLPMSEYSQVLFFTSAAAPEFDTATVAADWSATRELPSPTPEPATLGLMVLGLAGIAARRR